MRFGYTHDIKIRVFSFGVTNTPAEHVTYRIHAERVHDAIVDIRIIWVKLKVIVRLYRGIAE